jgi:SAM-dependent methyltransferase
MEHVRRAYGSIAALYIDLFGAEDKVHADDLALIRRHLTGRPGPVLDLGCGPGHLTACLRSHGAEAIGEMAARLAAAGFTEVERLLRADDPAHRPHGAIAATAGP